MGEREPQFTSESELTFETQKAAASDFLKRESAGEEDLGRGFYENTGKMDDGIRVLVHHLNQLPFLYTTGSCEGHIFFSKRLPEGKVLYAGGDITFEIDHSARSQQFITELGELVKGYADSGASLHMGRMGGLVHFSRTFGKVKVDIALATELAAKRDDLKSKIDNLVVA